MKYAEIRRHVKVDEATTYYTMLKRKAGIGLTWFILKLFPSVSANMITISMLPINVLAAGLAYEGIIQSQPFVILLAFLVSFFALCLDSVDGNIARINHTSSIKGVYLDRLVHNISHPMFFFVIGFALYSGTQDIIYLVVFILVGILSELSPLDISQKDVEALFIRQALLRQTKNYHFHTHQKQCNSDMDSIKTPMNSKLRKLIKTIFMNDVFYFIILLDLFLFENQFYLTLVYAFLDIAGMIVARLNFIQWEKNLHEILNRLYGLK
ncbi:CDP-alcohol phosphatidyltransferase family protein [Ornithinibacillus scapharcae]|uniref:CDP-alcohol phosphatidyltransferase family protein n=1 Tax=Ornithinibacillus scapharcae TaxID=1147159 RepID=UPI000225B2CF|nr:CDP-alcohol phosphatidyltransferase family protein [Ornithinibacillus scapharcae]